MEVQKFHLFDNIFRLTVFDKMILGMTIMDKYQFKTMHLINNYSKTFVVKDINDASQSFFVRLSLSSDFIKREL